MRNSQQAIRSAKDTILDVVGRTLDDALRIETLNAYTSLGDFSEARERLSQEGPDEHLREMTGRMFVHSIKTDNKHRKQ